jgi:hypothetical protein
MNAYKTKQVFIDTDSEKLSLIDAYQGKNSWVLPGASTIIEQWLLANDDELEETAASTIASSIVEQAIDGLNNGFHAVCCSWNHIHYFMIGFPASYE